MLNTKETKNQFKILENQIFSYNNYIQMCSKCSLSVPPRFVYVPYSGLSKHVVEEFLFNLLSLHLLLLIGL